MFQTTTTRTTAWISDHTVSQQIGVRMFLVFGSNPLAVRLLTKRFGPWYYVIDKTLFDKLKPARADLVQPKSEEAKPGDAPK